MMYRALLVEIDSVESAISSVELSKVCSADEFWKTLRRFQDLCLSDIGASVIFQEPEENNDISLVVAKLSIDVAGGKGGFGAQLRSLAKQKGRKQTTDFGACRDLSGRRLRNINHEIILAKWKEAHDKGEQLNIDQETPTGINLWFMAAPTWADTVKDSKQKIYLKNRIKTRVCGDWERSRAEKTASQLKNLPLHWGCPRGFRCPFAHGEEDLRGASKEQILEGKVEAKRNEAILAKEAYLKPLCDAAESQASSSIADSVAEGLLLQNATKKSKLHGSATHSGQLYDQEEVAQGKVEIGNNGVEVTNGQVIVSISPDGLGLIGTSNFGSTIVRNFVCKEIGEYYYEAELSTEGLMQIGWCRDPSWTVVGNGNGESTSETNGVGDDENSWGYDGMRQILLHSGSEVPCVLRGESTGSTSFTNITTRGLSNSSHSGNAISNEQSSSSSASMSWELGDSVGCLLSISRLQDSYEESSSSSVSHDQKVRVRMIYILQGLIASPSDSLTAFDFTCSLRDCNFCPAVSLENGESLVLNLQSRPFMFQAKANEALSKCNFQSTISDANDGVVSEVLNTKEIKSVDEVEDIDWATVHNVHDLLRYSMASLKQALIQRGVKCGGTHMERATRLYSIKNLSDEQIDSKLKVFPKK